MAEFRAELRTSVAELRAELHTSVAQLRGEMALRSDLADVRMEMGDLRNDTNRRLDLLDAKIDRHFVWLMGMMVTGFITVSGALVGVVDR